MLCRINFVRNTDRSPVRYQLYSLKWFLRVCHIHLFPHAFQLIFTSQSYCSTVHSFSILRRSIINKPQISKSVIFVIICMDDSSIHYGYGKMSKSEIFIYVRRILSQKHTSPEIISEEILPFCYFLKHYNTHIIIMMIILQCVN
jgi:hypothetical protein